MTHHHKKGHSYDDNLCLFRCLVLHFGETTLKKPISGLITGMETSTKMYKDKLESYCKQTFDNGVELDMLSSVEACFKIGINVYSLQEDKSAKVIRISCLDYTQDRIMHLNLFERHFSYIKSGKFKSIAKKFSCPNCSRILTKSCNLIRHVKQCRSEVEEVFKGGKYRVKKTIFEHLDTLNIHVPETDRYDPFFVVYDLEALQVPIETTFRGRKLHFEHVPVTVSICSNVNGHKEPVHIRSDGDPQQLVDSFVIELLKIQASRQTLLNEKYQPYLIELEKQKEEIEAKISQGRVEREVVREERSEGEEEDYEDNPVGKKRKRKQGKERASSSGSNQFLDDEAEVSDDDYDDVDIYESDDEVLDLIDDSSDIEDNNESFYRAVDNTLTPQPSLSTQSSMSSSLTDTEYDVEIKRLKRVKTFKTKLESYISQITVLGFNSQKYDIPLIRHYLPASIIRNDTIPKQIIKKMNGYMALSSEKLKFLDITNYLAAGTSLKDFYKSYNVSTPKGSFPYQWFDKIARFDELSLPERDRINKVFSKTF